MNSNVRIKLAAYSIVIAWSILMLIYGIKIPSLVGKIVGAVPLVLTGLFAIYDNWAWRWPIIIRLSGRPWIGGTWGGELTSYRRDESGSQIVTKHDVILRINQTFVTSTFVMMTEESRSRSMAATFATNDRGDYTLYYQYDNVPSLKFRDSSVRHWGGVMADIHGSAPVELRAEYWTSRETRGEFTLSLISRDQAASFDAGKTMLVDKGTAR